MSDSHVVHGKAGGKQLEVWIHSHRNKDSCNLCYCLLFSPELEKSLKKRVKLHTHENGENRQNEDIDSDDNYAEVGTVRFQHRPQVGSQLNTVYG